MSKAFDRINWDALWQSLLEHGVSAHLVWILQLLYCEQTGEVKGTWGNSTIFPIKAGVRQGCVLSPRLFCSVLQWAMQDWRAWAEGNGWGIDFHDGYPPLLEQRSKFHMCWSLLRLTRIHTRRKLFPEVRKVSGRFDVSHA